MASTTRTLTTNFVGRTKNLERSFKRVAKGSELMSDKKMRATRMAGIGFAALGGVAIGAAAALKPMIDKAAAMEEALSKNQLLLGESSKAVEAFADTSLESFGVTNLAALQATGVFASLGDAMGMSQEASASMATTLTGLAGDLSSLHDVSVETALTALRAGLIGEAEPLRKLGILLDAATIKTKALEMGLIKNTKDALTPAIKSQAAYALILEKGTTAMGDFARTSDSATNVSKQLAGQWEQIQIQIGTALLPAFTALVTHLVEEVMPAIEEFFEDPSWAAAGELAGEAVTSGFAKGLAELAVSYTLAMASLGLLPAANWLLNRWTKSGNDQGDALTLGFAATIEQFGRDNPDWYRGDWDPDASGRDAGDEFGTALTGGFAATIEQFGRDNPDWYRGDWDPDASGTADGLGYAAAFAAAVEADDEMRRIMQEGLDSLFGALDGGGAPDGGDLVPSPASPDFPGGGGDGGGGMGGGGGGTTLDPGQRGGGGGGMTMDPGQRAQAATASLTEEEALGLLSGRFVGRFGGVTVVPDTPVGGGVVNNFNITGVSPDEVLQSIGQYVDMNGPLPDWWTQ